MTQTAPALYMIALTATLALGSAQPAEVKGHEFTKPFRSTQCTFATTGRTPYVVLEPGHTLVLRNSKRDELTVTVLDRTEVVGDVTTRVVEERHTEGNVLIEVSLNYFAICAENKGVYYFGEAVDNYKNGKIENHNGAWRHGTAGAVAGLAMPSLPLIGARYYQEVAPGAAMDRAEIMSVDGALRTPYGALEGVLVTRETSPLEPKVVEFKSYAPGIGLVKDEDMLLVSVTQSATRR